MQRRVLLGVAAEQVGVGGEQQLDHLEAAVQRSQVQGSLKLVVPHGGVRQLLQQNPHHPSMAVLGSTVQRRFIGIVLLESEELVRAVKKKRTRGVCVYRYVSIYLYVDIDI